MKGVTAPRRWVVLIGWALLYMAIAAAAIGANPFRGETTGPFDLLASYSGWNPTGHAVAVRHPERSDIVDALVPAWLDARRQLREGTLPLWNPMPGGGRPALLDPTSSELTVGFALFAAAPDPALGFYLAVLSSLVIAGLGMHLLVARHHRPLAALFAGNSFMLCGFLTAWLFWPHTYSAIWIPWLLWAVDRFAASPTGRRLAPIATATALMFLGGFPFVVALGMGAALVFAVLHSVARHDRPDWRALGGTMAGLVLGLMLVAVPLLGLAASLHDADLAYRRPGSPYGLDSLRLLLLPWAAREPHVESNMYVGMLGLAFAAGGVLLVARRRAGILAATGAMLSITGVVLVCGLLPRSIGAHLPVLSNNPWNRAILLLDLGLVLLAAAGVDRLFGAIRRRELGVAIVLVLTALQGADLVWRFRAFDGPTPSGWFYQETPALTQLRQQVRPFQYVAMDNRAFMVSGTLGAIGLPDWFAHTLRSSEMHRLLEALAVRHDTTATATAIDVRSYRWSSSIADAAGLCYAVYPAGSDAMSIIDGAQGKRRSPYPLGNAPVEQAVTLAQRAVVAGAQFRLATYLASDVDGDVEFVLRDATGAVRSTAVIAGATVQDNKMARFRLPRPVVLEPATYRLGLRYEPGVRHRNLAAWVFSDAAARLERGGVRSPGGFDYALLGPDTDGLVELSRDARGMAVAENPGCATGPFWTPDLRLGREGAERVPVRLLAYRPHDFWLDVGAKAPGYAVVPMRMAPGWRVTSDGRELAVRRAAGVMPAVAVAAGTTRLHFHYRPPDLALGLAAMVLSTLLLGWLCVAAPGRRQAAR